MVETQLQQLVVNKLTRSQYESLKENNEIIEGQQYYITDDNAGYYTKGETLELLEDAASPSQSISASLDANGWSGTTGTRTQTISVSGLSATQNGIIGISQEASSAEIAMAGEALLYVSGQTDGSLTISAGGEVPTMDIPVTILLLG